MPDKPNVLVLGTADWDQAIATNQHYVVRELCRDGFADVTFVESMALRAPKLTPRDLRRIAARISRAASSGRSADMTSWRPRPHGLKVVSPLTLPWHRGPARLVNRQLVHRLASQWSSSTAPRILWTYTPATYGLEALADVAIYHCVDLLGEVPGIDRRVIEVNERRLAGITKTIATSKIVRSHLESMGHTDVVLWENVADTEVVEAAEPMTTVRSRNTAIFAGNLSPSKIDYELIGRLARSGIQVRLAGPRAEGGDRDSEQFARLLRDGVEYLGMLPLDRLAAELVTASVGIIPYKLNDYTRGVSPLKTFEYLAAGLPVVATELPGVSSESIGVYKESSHEAFVERVKSLSRGPVSADIALRTAAARTHSWSGRGDAIRELTTSVLRTVAT